MIEQKQKSGIFCTQIVDFAGFVTLLYNGSKSQHVAIVSGDHCLDYSGDLL